MQRVIDEAEYVLDVLLRMRDEVSTDPALYDADARQRIDDAIDRVNNQLRQARWIVHSEEQSRKAA